MYAPYFGLSQEPFSIAPDPRYLFMSGRHREALAHLLYGVGGGGGFVLLTGEIGTGKTTVCRCFLEQIPADTHVAYIFNPKLTALELLQSVCDEFRIEVPRRADGATAKDYIDRLNAFLLGAHAQGRNSVLIIDEAQNLSPDVLEQLRLLTNLETSQRKLLQIILIGQPELRELLARPELEQLAQRVIARYHLDALSRAETEQYVRHRLEVAGLARAFPFDRRALARVHQLTGGVPRRINLLCDRALLGAYARGEPAVNATIVRQAAREVFEAGAPRPLAARPAFLLGAGVAAGAALVLAARALLAVGADGAPESASAALASAAAASGPMAAASVPAASVEPPSPTVPPTLLRDEKQAWRELARAWSADPGAGDPCQALARESLHCYSRNTSLSLIRQLDRPGIVTLDRDSASPSFALLVALTDKTATLVAGGSTQTVTLEALAARWGGDWSTLWRSPPGMAVGTPTPALLRWVEQHLGAPADGARSQPLVARVRSFQLAQGLPADGLPGPMTLMQLNRQAGVDEPRLRAVP